MPSLWFAHALLPDGWADDVRVRMNGAHFLTVQPGVPAEPDDERHDIAIPGLANVHSHAFQRGMAGLAETAGPSDDDFWSWRETMYRFVLTLDPDQMEAIAALAFSEMLESGFTTVGEFHYLHHAADGAPYDNPAELAVRIAAAAGATGIGLTLLPVFYAHGNFGGVAPGPRQARFLNSIDAFARLVDGCRDAVRPLDGAVVGTAPHSLRAATPREIVQAAALANGGPVHIHAAEQTREVDDCVARLGARPVDFLLDQCGVDEHWCLIHATHIDAGETARLAASGAIAGLCPITESNLGDGIFPTRSYFDQDGRFGIGTDSNILISAGGELQALEYIQRLVHRARNVLGIRGGSTGRRLFDGAFSGGNQALGLGQRGIAPGLPADLVTFDRRHPSLAFAQADGALDAWIFAGAKPDCVYRFGRRLVVGGAHVDKPAILERYRRAIAGIVR